MYLGKFQTMWVFSSFFNWSALYGAIFLGYRAWIGHVFFYQFIAGLTTGYYPHAFVLQSDTYNYDQFCTGLKREAVYTAAISALWKLLRLPGEVFPFVIMDYLGYDSDKSTKNCDANGRDGHCQNLGITILLYVCMFYIPFYCEAHEKVLMLKFKLREFVQNKLIMEGIQLQR